MLAQDSVLLRALLQDIIDKTQRELVNRCATTQKTPMLTQLRDTVFLFAH